MTATTKPATGTNSTRERLSVWINPGITRRLKALAAQKAIPLWSVTETALTEYLERQERKK